MPTDDLTAPLGQNAKKKKRRFELGVILPRVIAGALVLCLAVFAGWALVANDPLGGEPMVVVSAAALASKAEAPMATVMPAPGQGPRSYAGPGQPPANEPAAPPGTKTVTIIDGSTGKRQEAAIPGPRGPQGGLPQLEPRLLEHSRHGAIPKVTPDGVKPSEAYARPLKNPGKPGGARIAIVIGGLGISTSATESALSKLPGPITLAFAPYAADAERLVTRARAENHEVLLQVPMEPFDYPDNDPGPQTLLMSLPADQNLDRMHWLMSRFQGYVGIVSYMGARFTSSEQALAPVLRETAKRGLIYVDDGSSARSLAGQIANASSLPFAKAEIVLDAVPNPVNIDRALTRLEAMARERGVAVGIASSLPAAIERIALWAKTVESRGITLVPISAVALKPKSS